jgi:hypothetical protein
MFNRLGMRGNDFCAILHIRTTPYAYASIDESGIVITQGPRTQEPRGFARNGQNVS